MPKVPFFKDSGHCAKILDYTLQAPNDLRVKTQLLTLDLWGCPLENGQKLAMEQMRPRKFPAHPQNTRLQENTSGGLILHVKRILKDLIYEKFLFTLVKRNSIAIKMDK